MDAAQMATFARVLARTQTPEIALWDAMAYTRATGWGAYFEAQVAQLRPRHSADAPAAPLQEDLDGAWLQACLGSARSGAATLSSPTSTHTPSSFPSLSEEKGQEEEEEVEEERAWVRMFWAQVSVDDLRQARLRLVDRYILHSPFVDANPALVRLVIDRATGGGEHHLAEIVHLLKERAAVDATLVAAHESLELLRSSLHQDVSKDKNGEGIDSRVLSP